MPGLTNHTDEDDIRFNIQFGLRKGLTCVRGMRRALTDVQIELIVSKIVDHLKLCGWKWRYEVPPPAVAQSQRDKAQDSSDQSD